MSMATPSDYDEISDRPFIAPERKKIRFRMRTYDRVEWLFRQLRIWFLWVIGLPSGALVLIKAWENSGEVLAWLASRLH